MPARCRRSGRPTREVLLDVDHVTLRFGGVVALDDVSFSLYKGEILGLIGPNGAGKTTCFNVMTGVYKPTVGRGAVRRPADHRPQAARDQPDGHRPHVPEHPAVPGDDRARERHGRHRLAAQDQRARGAVPAVPGAGQAGGAAAGRPRATAWSGRSSRSAARRRRSSGCPGTPWRSGPASASRCDLLRLRRHRATGPTTLARNLPYGDQRRLEIARALATEPKLLCLDEPAAGFNPAEKEELLQLIQRIRDMGYTVLLIEHDMRLVMGVTDRIVVLEFGKKIAEGCAGRGRGRTRR